MTVRFDFSRYDSAGRQLEVQGEGHEIAFRIDDPYANPRQRLVAGYELDDDAAIRLAHDLLERVLPVADCDEITVAVAALRELADREPPEPDVYSERDIDWRDIADAHQRTN